eukprot:s4710_g11.t1
MPRFRCDTSRLGIVKRAALEIAPDVGLVLKSSWAVVLESCLVCRENKTCWLTDILQGISGRNTWTWVMILAACRQFEPRGLLHLDVLPQLQRSRRQASTHLRLADIAVCTGTAAAAFAMTDAEISPVSPGVFPRGSSASRGRSDACSASSSSRIINVKAVEEDAPSMWERESVSSVASLRSEGKWRLEEGKELLRKVEIETPRAQLKTPQVGSQSDQMLPPGTRLDLIPPRTFLADGKSPVPATHGFLPEVAQSDGSDSSDEMPEGEVAFGAAFDSSFTPSRKRWSQERLKSLDDPVSPVKHSGREAYDQQAGGGYDRPSSASSHSSSDGHSGSQQGSSAAHSSTSKASNGLVRKLTEQLGYSWHQAIEAAKRTSSVEAAVEWLEEKEGANNATRWGRD